MTTTTKLLEHICNNWKVADYKVNIKRQLLFYILAMNMWTLKFKTQYQDGVWWRTLVIPATQED
jgi:hypothetical protein